MKQLDAKPNSHKPMLGCTLTEKKKTLLDNNEH